MFATDPPPTPWDLHFHLFRIPVRIHPFFWLVSLLLGLSAREPIALVVWMVAVFVSILVHELGHAAVMRSFGYYPSITLYAMGGLASYGPAAFGARNPGTLGQIAIAAAGPATAFAIAGLLYAALTAAGYPVITFVGLPFGILVFVPAIVVSRALTLFINDLLLISVLWGILNLLPIYPLDGGHIAREVLVRVNPAEGARWSLMISFVTAGLLAVFAAVRLQDYFAAVFFGYLAYVSYATLAFYSTRGRWW